MKALFDRIIKTGDCNSLLPLRIAVGATFAAHGAQKLFGWFGGHGLQGTGQFFESKLGLAPGIVMAGMAGGAEFFGGLLILLGFLTRFGAVNVAFCMLVAIAKVHHEAFFLPKGMEYCVILLAAAITLIIGGGGKYSIDRCLSRSE